MISKDKIETAFSPTVRAFERNFITLINRNRRLKSLHGDPEAWWTYFDAILVQLRAICIENNDNVDKNYTVQGVLRRLGCEELREDFNDFLGQMFCLNEDEHFSYRDIVKKLVDKFICHYDNYDITEHSNAVTLEERNKLVDFLINKGHLDNLISKIGEVIQSAIDSSNERFQNELIIKLFGSEENYRAVQNYQWPMCERDWQ